MGTGDPESIGALARAALALEPHLRSRFLDDACGRDSELRAAVARAISRIETPQSCDTQTSAATETVRQLAPRAFEDGDVACGRFRILRLIGHGGMGEVYEALDLELQENVALKTILPGMAPDEHAIARFKREIQLSRRVTHPNVCRVFDLARHPRPEGGDITFLTMELLAGESLAARLRRDGRMQLPEALPLALDMASGLAAAHAAGIIHRDFKGANVMLVPSAGGPRAVITDFGVARSTADDAAGGATMAGTPAYMAPEQLVGARVSEATDIYAFGVVLYEMITGERPFEQASSIAEVLTAPPPSPRRVLPAIDERWEQAIRRCLDPDPARRFRTASDVAQALTAKAPDAAVVPRRNRTGRVRVAAAVFAFLVLIAALALRGTALRSAPPLPSEKHIAVLPFKNIGGDPASQAFCDGIAETLASKLSELEAFQKSLWVVPASESSRIQDAGTAHRTLGATLVIDGNFQRVGGTAKLTVNLIDATTRRLLASRTIKAPVSELGELDERASERVAGMLQMQLNPQARAALEAGNSRVSAANELLQQAKGYASRGSPEDQDRAIGLFEKAVEKDPGFAAAHAGLGDACARKFETTGDPRWIERCREHSTRACDLDDRAPLHIAAGQALYRAGQYEEAAGEFKRATQLNGSSAEGHLWLGRSYQELDEASDAEQAYLAAIRLRPGYPAGYQALGSFYQRNSRFKDAEGAFQKAIALAPGNLEAYDDLGAVYLSLARYADAEAIARNSISIRPSARAYSALGRALLLQGRRQDAVPALEEAVKLGEELVRENPADAGALAVVALDSARLGRGEQARSYAAQATRRAPGDREVLLTAAEAYEAAGWRQGALEVVGSLLRAGLPAGRLASEPELAPLRADARFAGMLKRGSQPR